MDNYIKIPGYNAPPVESSPIEISGYPIIIANKSNYKKYNFFKIIEV